MLQLEPGLSRPGRQVSGRSGLRSATARAHRKSPPAETSGPPATAGSQEQDVSLNQRNRQRLQALALSQDPCERLRLRHAVVRDNLPLVYSIVARIGLGSGLSLEDLRQIGCLGLVKAVDAFDPARGGQLSSFAVPYIRGAIQRELRDRHSIIRVPRDLWDLRRRAMALLERRRLQGERPLAPRQLADHLGCDRARLEEALQLGAVTEMRSLDAPLAGEAGEAGERLLLDTLADPASLAPEALQAPRPLTGTEADGPAGAGRRWLAQALAALEPRLLHLVLGHMEGRSWVELGRELELHPRQAQRLTVATLARLQGESRRWLMSQSAIP